MKRITQLFAVIASAAALACGGAAQEQGSSAEVDVLTYDPVVTSQSLSDVALKFPWELDNPTAQKAGVGKITWTLTIDGEAPVSGETVAGVDAAAGAKANGAIEVKAPLSTTEEAFAAHAKKPGLRYTLAARLNVASGTNQEDFEAEWHGEIFGPRKPKVKLKAEAGRYGDRSFELNFLISLVNPNPFPVTVDGLEYTLFVNDVQISKDLLASNRQIDPSSELQFDVQRFIGKDDLQDLANAMMGMKIIPYHLNGTLKVQGIDIAAPIKGEITFAR